MKSRNVGGPDASARPQGCAETDLSRMLFEDEEDGDLQMAVGKPIQVLVVEDNPADADLAKEMFEQGSINLAFSFVPDGEAALLFLRRLPPYAGAPRPKIILLDLNLPRLSGREVIAEVRRDPELKGIPIIVLSSSDAESDVTECYELGANCYVKKPMDITLYSLAARQIERFWLSVAKLPPNVEPGASS